MKCPHCDVALLMTERQGIEIDYCPECRGVWLDRGELDKILERAHAEAVGAGAPAPAPAPAPVAAPAPPRDDRGYERRGYEERRYDDRYDDRRGYEGAAYKKKKKKSFLEDIFEFGG